MTAAAAMSAAEVIALLGLTRHPEGGHYRQTFEDGPAAGGRAASTAIYFLLAAGQRSHWHRVSDAAEVWHFYAGAPLILSVSPDCEVVTDHRLGNDLSAGERPQIVVPANSWQAARSLGAWTLVGCTVAPGFRFSSFELAEPGWRPGTGRS